MMRDWLSHAWDLFWILFGTGMVIYTAGYLFTAAVLQKKEIINPEPANAQ